MKLFTIAIDFDKTLVEDAPFPSYDYELKPNAEKVIRRLVNRGHKFVINTARYGWYRIPAILFCKKHKLPVTFHLFNKKEVADFYIDDRNIDCKKINWLTIYRKILIKEKECIISKND